MIRKCLSPDFKIIYKIINEAAMAYKGIIPGDRWKEPYMPEKELLHEISRGVQFWGYQDDHELIAVMGIQDKGPVTLIRHAYTLSSYQGQGLGTALLKHLHTLTSTPVLIGTWARASWAIDFYERNGFRLVTEEEKNRLLNTFWDIPERQIETSVVLADETFFSSNI